MPDLPPGEKRLPPAWLLLGLLPVILYGAVEWTLLGELGFPLDDSWIHLQFGRSLAAGDGLSFQGGRWVAASTSPLWSALLALVAPLPGSPLLWAKVLGVGFFLLAGWELFRLARQWRLSRGVALLAACLLFASSWMVWGALSGMEIPLFCWLTLAVVRQHGKEREDPRRAPLSYFLIGLATLARPEGILLLPAAVVSHCLHWPGTAPSPQGNEALEGAEEGEDASPHHLTFRWPWQRLAWGLALCAAVLLPMVVLYLSKGASPLPTTFDAKVGGGAGWQIQRSYLLTVVSILFKPQPLLLLLAGGGLCLAILDRGHRIFLAALWLVGMPLGYALLSPLEGSPLVGNLGRYIFPLLPFVILFGCVVVDRLWRSLPGRPLLVVILLAPTLVDLTQSSMLYGRNVTDIFDGDVRLARWLRQEVPPEAVVAVQDVGAVGYLAPQRLIDLSALITPEIREPVQRDGLRGLWRFLEEERPDLIAAFPKWAPPLTADPRRLRPLHRIEIEGNITLGADTIVVYNTPWNRFPQLTAGPGSESPGGPAPPP